MLKVFQMKNASSNGNSTSSTTMAEVIEPIQGSDRIQRGRVKAGGVLWFAISTNSQSIEAGISVRIISREGVYLRVEKLHP